MQENYCSMRDHALTQQSTLRIMTKVTMMTRFCMQRCGLISMMVYLNVEARDIWEGIMIRRTEIYTTNIRSL